MAYISREALFKGTTSIFKLTLMAAKRAIELNEGAPALVDAKGKKISTVALEEIGQGKVRYKVRK